MSWGADLRVRNEYFNDLLTLNPNAPLHEQDYFRFRGRLWTSIMPVDDLSLNARIADEAREWMKPAGYTPIKGQSGLDMEGGHHRQPQRASGRTWRACPLTVKVGRQDMFLGDGWLVGDGTPIDGSWTYYLDSARFTYELKDQHTTIDAIGIIQDAHDDAWLPDDQPQSPARDRTERKGRHSAGRQQLHKGRQSDRLLHLQERQPGRRPTATTPTSTPWAAGSMAC